MKTIFITIFEGVEGKNILRTEILSTLLSDPEVRLVLFTKNAERADYHKREFNNERIFYEVVQKPPLEGLDKFFMYLKFMLLRTSTTRIQRKMTLERGKNYLFYCFEEFLNRLLARPIFIRISRFLDFKLVKNAVFSEYFDKYNPDLVFLANLFDEHEIHLLREAKRRKVKTVGLINSWDRVTARCILRLLPEKLVVFNNLIKEELIKHDAVKENDIFVGGIPHYDLHFHAPYCGRNDFFRKMGISENKKIVVYSPVGFTYFGDADWHIIDLLERLSREGRLGKDVAILVRFPPNDFFSEQDFEKRPNLIYDYPGTRFCKKRGVDWDMTIEELKHLSDTLFYMSLLVCYASSISIDASVLDKPIININFDIKKNVPKSKSTVYIYQKEHYQRTVRTGGIRLIKDEDDLVYWINRYLNNPALDSEGRTLLAKEQCQFLDGKSGERIGKFVLSLTNSRGE